jgi:sensor histidine kinase regulating citrate/malate metabolism
MKNTQIYIDTFTVKQVRMLIILSMLASSLVSFTAGYFFAKNLEQSKITRLINEKNAIIAALSSNTQAIDEGLLKPQEHIITNINKPKQKKSDNGIVIGDEKYW